MMSKIKIIVAIVLYFLFLNSVNAQVDFSLFNQDITRKACQDFFTYQAMDPLDMSNSDDINNFFYDTQSLDVQQINNITFSNGEFSGTIAGDGASAYILSPDPCGSDNSFANNVKLASRLPIDTSKYDKLVVQMSSDVLDPIGLGLMVDWDCNYASIRSLSNKKPIKRGYRSYVFDLNTDIPSATTGDNWSNGTVYGISVLPSVKTGLNFSIDHIALINSSTCASDSISYSVSGASPHSVWIVKKGVTNPLKEGFFDQPVIADTTTGNSTLNISYEKLPPGKYQLFGGQFSGDYFSLVASNPIDFNEEDDLYTTSGDVESYSISGGVLSGTIGAGGGNLYFPVDSNNPIDLSKFTKLSFGLKTEGLDASDPQKTIRVVADGGREAFLTNANIVGTNSNGVSVYQIDLSTVNTWNASGTSSILIINPGVFTSTSYTFTLDFVVLGTEFVNDFDVNNLSFSSSVGLIKVNSPPTFEFLSPGKEGGEAFRNWNHSSSDDILFTQNINTSESYYLLDANVDGNRNDFFLATSQDGSDDPYIQYLFNSGNSNDTFNPDEYKYICFKQEVNKSFSLGGGSVARIIYGNENNFFNTDDLPLYINLWNNSDGIGFFSGCADMSKVNQENSSSAWNSANGTFDILRFDPFEFATSTQTYIDYFILRKAHTTEDGIFYLTFKASDSDNDPLTIKFYYNSTESTSGGTLIGSASEKDLYLKWDTTNVPSGTYYIYATIDDGVNPTMTVAAKTPIVVDSTSAGAPPKFIFNTPSEGSGVCDSMQVTGYVQDDSKKIPIVKVSVTDSNNTEHILGISKANEYNPTSASADYKNYGFNHTYSISSIASGTVTLKVATIVGGRLAEETITLNKNNSTCQDEYTFPDPQNNKEDSSLNQPSSTPLWKKNPKFLAKKGLLKLILSRLLESGDTSCNISIYTGTSSDNLNFVKTLSVSKEEKTFSAKIRVKKKRFKDDNGNKISKLYFQVKKECAGFDDSYSEIKSAKIKGKKGVKKFSKFLTKLAKKLK